MVAGVPLQKGEAMSRIGNAQTVWKVEKSKLLIVYVVAGVPPAKRWLKHSTVQIGQMNQIGNMVTGVPPAKRWNDESNW